MWANTIRSLWSSSWQVFILMQCWYKIQVWFVSVWVQFSTKAPSLHVGRILVVDLLLNFWYFCSSSVRWEWIYLFFFFFLVYHCTKIISKYTEASTAVICVFWCVLWQRENTNAENSAYKGDCSVLLKYIHFYCCIGQEKKAVQSEMKEKCNSYSWVKKRRKNVCEIILLSQKWQGGTLWAGSHISPVTKYCLGFIAQLTYREWICG